MQMLESLARAANVDRSVIEHTPHYCLIDCDGFNFIHVHFSRVPSDKSLLINHSVIGNDNFSSPLLKPSHNSKDHADSRSHKRKYKSKCLSLWVFMEPKTENNK